MKNRDKGRLITWFLTIDVHTCYYVTIEISQLYVLPVYSIDFGRIYTMYVVVTKVKFGSLQRKTLGIFFGVEFFLPIRAYRLEYFYLYARIGAYRPTPTPAFQLLDRKFHNIKILIKETAKYKE